MRHITFTQLNGVDIHEGLLNLNEMLRSEGISPDEVVSVHVLDAQDSSSGPSKRVLAVFYRSSVPTRHLPPDPAHAGSR
jgi:hypothetical protein